MVGEIVVIRYRIKFLSNYEGFGWMELEETTRTLYRIIADDGTDLSGASISYCVIDE